MSTIDDAGKALATSKKLLARPKPMEGDFIGKGEHLYQIHLREMGFEEVQIEPGLSGTSARQMIIDDPEIVKAFARVGEGFKAATASTKRFHNMCRCVLVELDQPPTGYYLARQVRGKHRKGLRRYHAKQRRKRR